MAGEPAFRRMPPNMYFEKQIAETRQLIAASLRTLRECPKPSTFIGIKTQEAFLEGDDDPM
jgi:hypothetical protein